MGVNGIIFLVNCQEKKKTCLRNYARKAALGLEQNSQTGYHPSNIPALITFLRLRPVCGAMLFSE